MTGGSRLRLVPDQGIPRDAAALLRDEGFDCLHVGEVGMSRAKDGEILSFSISRNAAIVTLDADFHAMLAVSGAAEPSVIRVRMQGLDAAAVAGIVKQVIAEYLRDVEAGCLITVKSNKTTCHRLPIGRSYSDAALR